MEKTTVSRGNSVVNDLSAVGAHFGFVKSRRHPSAQPYIYGIKNKIEIFDLEKTQEAMEKACGFVETIATKGGTILFVGGKEEAKKTVADAASGIGQPFVAGRFIGGTLTNFPEIRKRVDKLESLVSQKEKGELAKYTKKERLLIDREIVRLQNFFSGLSAMKNLPKVLFVVDARRESIAVKEAKTMGIPVVALCGSDNNLSEVEYAIPGNDSSRASITYFVKAIVDAWRRGELKKGTEQQA